MEQAPRVAGKRMHSPASHVTSKASRWPSTKYAQHTTSTKGDCTMPTTRFKSTIEALKDGPESLPVEKAVTNIEGWEEYLSKHEHDGVKKVSQDLTKLKKLLHAKEVDHEAIHTLLQKLGKDTVAVAESTKGATSEHIKELGEALSAGK
ncbi:hypothetical protein D1Y84_06270 [Acidipila sp. EB88]|nr:hypothetical protein D1Y84_06270 [Acidipila sp. EB88]